MLPLYPHCQYIGDTIIDDVAVYSVSEVDFVDSQGQASFIVNSAEWTAAAAQAYLDTNLATYGSWTIVAWQYPKVELSENNIVSMTLDMSGSTLINFTQSGCVDLPLQSSVLAATGNELTISDSFVQEEATIEMIIILCVGTVLVATILFKKLFKF